MKLRILSTALAALLCLGGVAMLFFPSRAAQSGEEPSIPTSSAGEQSAPARDTSVPADPPPEIIPEPTPESVTLDTIRAFTFPDIVPGSPTADAISYTAHLGLLRGVEDGLFDPDGLVTRAMVVTVLYRISGEEFEPAGSFSDVSADDWFAPAAAWAAKTDIATGYEDSTFRPYLPVTRSQLAAFCHRFAAYDDGRDYSTVLSRFYDSKKLPDYAWESMAWALENRLFAGMVFDTIYPDLPVTRAQLAQVLTALTAYSGGDEIAETITDSLRVTSVSFTPEAHELLQAEVDAAAKKYGAMGMQVAVLHNGQLIDAFAYGWATKNTDPMTVEHKIRVASLSKVDVALAAMVLWDQGVIDLEESIGTYWGATMRNPYYKDVPVSIDSILSHTSSIGLFENASLRKAAVKSNLTSSSGYSYMKPGALSSHGYNNYAFGALGMTLELAAGQYLDTVMRDGLWEIMEIDAAFEGGCVERTDLIANLYQNGRSEERRVGKECRL